MVLTLYINKVNEELPESLKQSFRTTSFRELKVGGAKNIKIAHIKSGTITVNKTSYPYFIGKVFFKTKFKDFSYDVTDELVAETNPTEGKESHEILFTILLNEKIVIFSNKKEGKKFGQPILSYAISGSTSKISSIGFKPTAILNAYKKGEFSDIWYNGVHGDSKITSTNQYGSDFIDDPEFIDKANRYGVGVEISSGILGGTKVAIFNSGVINCLTSNLDTIGELKNKIELWSIFSKFI